ncbi:tryptophan synthase subunit alpha [Helcobacillus massiliensis]|uniref:tryptophan synthase subunit alpha n=1 Tax=Helcobacillus TaxID=1161125 RepID=UPI001EF6A887|nr:MULTISPECIES: tryptophan synthase subunit alpha [Helcobacillus]MCG7426439.1 tryptophan synthase subunit alpha [Helcobacillus sp. ACRRO]MCT1556980.1 tryptophan synthase subunit alpha [Helcobacillus massiliensis]MCT2035369.1 tryptophan synthase subunit alpha [Helcobacillus massiliensis]MCT2331416.1 tryptophan synthase subunit alpha [Helcobacillus massiliensis]MDK7741050.1 tryptophan synthase subunit alpha [Helcobacillus massiliensis]
MTRLRSADVIDRARAEGRSALIAYLPVGFPTLDRSIDAAHVLTQSGVDAIEFGVPYTDPVMDGPVIQQAADIALKNGTRPRDVIAAIDELSGRDCDAALLVMSYYNPILAYGPDAFARDLAAAGGAGVITPDLVPDEGAEWIDAAAKHEVDRVFLVAPSSDAQRLEYVVRSASGFIYAASTMGVTGMRASVGSRARDLVDRTRRAGAERVCVGLGVSTGAQAADIASYADGVIVGSAFVRAILEADDRADAHRRLEALATELRRGVEGA